MATTTEKREAIKRGDVGAAKAMAQDERAKNALRKAGLSTDLSGYTDAQRKRAAELADEDLAAARLREKIMGRSRSSKGSAKRPEYGPEIREAAKVVREVLTGADGKPKGAPGAKQIVAVIGALDGADPVQASGLGARKLASYAKGDWKPAAGERPEKMREIAQLVKDPWVGGRRLAAILHALAVVAKKGAATG